MNVQAEVPKEHPMRAAWEAYRATPEYANTRAWALKEPHVDGSLWAAFISGYGAAPKSEPLLPSAADEPVAEVACNVFAEPFVKFADGSKLADHIGDKFYPRPASARPSAGGEAVAGCAWDRRLQCVMLGNRLVEGEPSRYEPLFRRPAAGEPVGDWVLVPREPTPGMLAAGAAAYSTSASIYAAMLAAAQPGAK